MPLKMKKLTLIAVGIIIHNIPEGLSVGTVTAPAISLQDIPEGLVVSLPIYALGGGMIKEVFLKAYSEGKAFATTLGFLAGVLLMLFLDTVSF